MFAMRLAKAVGRVDYRKMLREMETQDFYDWKAFERIEPWGDEWRQTSTISTVIANEIRRVAAMFGSGQLEEKDLYQLSNFVPHWHDERLTAESEEIGKALDSLELR